MIPEDAKRFLSDVAFVAFPSVREWLRSTERPEKTADMWRAALADLTWGECEAIVTKWVSGQIPPPRFLRDNFIAELRACVMFERSKRMRREESEDLAETIGKPAYHPTQDDIYITHWLPLLQQVKDGTMAPERAKRIYFDKLNELIPQGPRL